VSGVAAERARAIAGSEAARILFPAPTCLQGFDRLLHWDLLPSYGVGFLYGTRDQDAGNAVAPRLVVQSFRARKTSRNSTTGTIYFGSLVRFKGDGTDRIGSTCS
jgi:hypothetical protein